MLKVSDIDFLADVLVKRDRAHDGDTFADAIDLVKELKPDAEKEALVSFFEENFVPSIVIF